jgi:hypothetical protein
VIRQAISCDICGNEKRQTNHWYVAYEHGGELRLSGWSSRIRLRAGTKHLCGQTCLHKLVDDFIARTMDVRPQSTAAAVAGTSETSRKTDTSLTAITPVAAMQNSTRQFTSPESAISPATPLKPQRELLAMPGRVGDESFIPPPEPRFASRTWRAEAWERERERELRGSDRNTGVTRRRSSA